MDGSLIRDRAGNKFVGSHAGLLAVLNDLDDRLFSDELAAFHMVNFAALKEHNRVDFTRVNVQRVDSMPRAAIEAGAAGRIVPLDALPSILQTLSSNDRTRAHAGDAADLETPRGARR